MAQSTIFLGERILAVRCLDIDRDFQLADLARSYLAAQGLVDGAAPLQHSSGEPIEPSRLFASDSDDSPPPPLRSASEPRPWTPYTCPCSCHCGEYECDDCYEPIDSDSDSSSSTEAMEEPAETTTYPASSTYSSSSAAAAEAAASQEAARPLLLYPADAPIDSMSGVALRQTANGVEMLRVAHRETSYYVFWTDQRVHAEPLGSLVARPVEPL